MCGNGKLQSRALKENINEEKEPDITLVELEVASESQENLNGVGDTILERKLSENGQYFVQLCKPNPETHSMSPEECLEHTYTEYYSAVDNGYIGRKEEVKSLEKLGLILIQKSDPSHNCCSIGYNPEENKWYGWSHRAMYGFTIGDEVHEGDLTATTGFVKEYAIQHPEECRNLPVGFKALTLNDAKRMAIAFAEAVS